MKKISILFALFFTLFLCSSQAADASRIAAMLKEVAKLEKDLAALRISQATDLGPIKGAQALIEAVNPFTKLNDVCGVINYVVHISPLSVNVVPDHGSSALMLAVHGVFHAPVEQIRMLFDGEIDITIDANKDALCELYKSAQYLHKEHKDNARAVASLLIQNGLRCTHDEHWQTFKKYVPDQQKLEKREEEKKVFRKKNY